MKLSKKDVEHIAKLARLDLSEEEKSKYSSQLTKILDYIDQLQEVDTTKVEPTYQVTDLSNVTRDDELQSCDSETMEKIKANWPNSKDNLIKVRAVFDTDNSQT